MRWRGASDSRARQPHPHWSSRALERYAAAAVWLLMQGAWWRLLEWSERRGGHTAARRAAARCGAWREPEVRSSSCCSAWPRRWKHPGAQQAVSLHAAEREACLRQHLLSSAPPPPRTCLSAWGGASREQQQLPVTVGVPRGGIRTSSSCKHLMGSALARTHCARRCLSWAEGQNSLGTSLDVASGTCASTHLRSLMTNLWPPPLVLLAATLLGLNAMRQDRWPQHLHPHRRKDPGARCGAACGPACGARGCLGACGRSWRAWAMRRASP